MTSFWILVIAALGLSAVWLVMPFLRRTEVERDETDAALSIYRDQADEVHRDMEAGLISQSEFDAAQREIEVRALRAARDAAGGMSVSHRSPAAAAIVLIAIGLGSVGGYLWLGSPAVEDQPLAARKTEALIRQAEKGDINSQIKLLVQAVKEDPETFENWWLLAKSYAATGDNASAADAYRRAAELSENDPGVLSAYAEAMTLANGNKVPQAAKILFEQVRAKTNDPRARYYLALAKAQAQDFEGALNDWAALAAESDPRAPWMQLVRRDIVNMARFTKRNVKHYLPEATGQEVAKASGEGNGMDPKVLSQRASDLDQSLKADPSDYKGWQELAKIRAALGEEDQASAAIEAARKHFAAAPFVLSKINQTAASLGLDLVRSQPGVRNPTEEDIAAVQSLSQDEQADLIQGMVAGLAAKLEENPDNPDGWAMLVRSYATLGNTKKAAEAFAKAEDHYSSDPIILARIKRDVGDLINE